MVSGSATFINALSVLNDIIPNAQLILSAAKYQGHFNLFPYSVCALFLKKLQEL